MGPREDAGHAAWFLIHTSLYSVEDAAGLQSYVQMVCAMVELFPCPACRTNARANQALQRHLATLRLMTWGASTRSELTLWACRAHLLVSATTGAPDNADKARWRELAAAARRRGAAGRRALLEALDSTWNLFRGPEAPAVSL
jgi:hypothetical protein